MMKAARQSHRTGIVCPRRRAGMLEVIIVVVAVTLMAMLAQVASAAPAVKAGVRAADQVAQAAKVAQAAQASKVVLAAGKAALTVVVDVAQPCYRRFHKE